jgi:hypothetical protein
MQSASLQSLSKWFLIALALSAYPSLTQASLSVAPANRILEDGQCTTLKIQGGTGPYRFRINPPSLGRMRPNRRFCANRNVYGTATVRVTDATGRRALDTLKIRGPLTRISTNPKDWFFVFGRNMPTRPVSNGQGGWMFDFPKMGQGILSYLMHPTRGGRPEGSEISARVEIVTEGDVIFDHYTEPNNTSPYPAHARFMIQRMPYLTEDENDRWWSRLIAIKLEKGTHEIRVPIDPAYWSNVYGKIGNSSPQALRGFRRALKETDQIGFTFGGGNFYGHGVRVKNGTATFILHEMWVD